MPISNNHVAADKWSSTTAGGSRVEIPRKPLDILFAGCSCVDYSNMNPNKPEGRVPSLDRHLKHCTKKKSKGKKKAGEEGEEESPPVQIDQAFVDDLDAGLEELLLKSAGESARTFFAAVKLISSMRPKAIILENVYGAPWDMYTDQIFPKICYVARCVKLDSKDFYLPQTRQRGYLVAIDALQIGEALASRIASEWEVLLAQCKHPASTSISAFLRPPDDPATIQARADMENKPTHNSEWALCSLRHSDARRKNGLRRDDNPFSKKAMRGGRLIFASYPSHSWRRFWETQSSRIIDLMDIAFATSIKRGTDLGYKTCMIDVSQNVDRCSFAQPGRHGVHNLGIVGCITPSGMPIVTDLMRPVTGTETLALQGLPVDELVISTETQAQLRDLAGNAMTVTVVGAAALALILSVSRLRPTLFARLQSSRSSRGLYLNPPETEALTPGRASDTTLDIQQLLAVAKQMARVCHCFPQASDVLVCNACGATACTSCSGNPEHDFSVARSRGSVLVAEQGKVHLKNLVPAVLVLPVSPSVVRRGLSSVKDQLYCSVVADILTKNPVYYFDEIKVTEAVTVCYKAVNSIARLVLSTDFTCCWYIYVAPWHTARAGLSKTFDLDQPIARGQLSEDNPSPHWSVWVHDRVDLTLQLDTDATGAIVASDLAFANHQHEAEPNESLLAWKQAVEKKVHGTYAHHPLCGTAGNALRVKQSSPAAPKVFMMWESAKLGEPELDHFVWTGMARRVEPHEYRETFLHATPELSWGLDSGLGCVDVFWPGYWASSPEAPKSPAVSSPEFIRDSIQVRWGLAGTIQQALCHVDGQPPATRMPVLATLTATFSQFPVSPARLSKIDSGKPDERSFYVVPATGCDAFLRLFAFLSNEVRLSRLPNDLALFPHLRGEWVRVSPCHDCSVTPPDITVHVKQDPRKKNNGEKKFKKEIIEDPHQAAKFERQFQDLPRAVALAARLLHNHDGASTLDVRVMLQPRTLASRALAYLRQAHRTVSRGSLALSADAMTSFTVTLDYASPPAVGFAPFRNSIQACGENSTAGIDLTSEWKMPDGGPPRFCREAEPKKKMAAARYSLRPSQRDAVKWMLQRENAPLDFVKAEIEEEVVRPLNMRVTGKAEWANCFPYSARGGVVAHEIGYGKTVVTLALLDYMRAFDQTTSIEERKAKVDSAWLEELRHPFEKFGGADEPYENLEPGSFFCHLSATLVIVPKHITDQWAAEAEKFLGLTRRRQVLIIKTVKGFYEGYTLDRLKEAEIIIVSSAVFGSGFLERLQTIAGRGHDYPKGLSGRTLDIWYQQALRNHRVLVAYYLSGQAAGVSHDELMRRILEELLPALIKKQQAEIRILLEKQVPDSDRRLYGIDGTGRHSPTAASSRHGDDGNDGPLEGQQAVMEEEATPTIGSGQWNITWLHSCSFARVIWDECSYNDKDHIPLFVSNAVANAKWLISGTPKLFGLAEVCAIADSFGIHVARPEPRMMPGLPAVTAGPQPDQMSKSEEFHVFSSAVKSTALAQERHSRAQAFVAYYFRANALEPDQDVHFEEHVRPIVMSPSTSVRYHLLNQEVLDSGYDYTALPAHARGEVALKGSDLTATDGTAAAKMLLGLFSCGLGRAGVSIDDLKRELSERSHALGGQLKLLWDKMMWLRRWIVELNKSQPGSRFSDPVQDTLERVDIWCNGLRKALLGEGDSCERDVSKWEAGVVACLPGVKPEEYEGDRPGPASTRSALKAHFKEGWMDQYNENMALYTWLDFFEVPTSAVKSLTQNQLRLLAQDICWLRYKTGQHAEPLRDELPGVEFLRQALAAGGKSGCSRAIPEDIKSLVASDRRLFDADNGFEEEDLRAFVLSCIEAKPPKEKWDGTVSFDCGINGTGKNLKPSLQERLTELNLKFNASNTTNELKEILWKHHKGLTVFEQYRDGRAPPSRYREWKPATGCGGTVQKQMDAATEELKYTLVHLAKTIEDLRATRLESNFVPRYSSLTSASDNDDAVKDMPCDGCRQPLGSAASSFLVVACGHFLCGKCKSQAGFYCPVTDCPAFIRKRPLLRCSQVLQNCGDEPCTKADCVADLIRKEIPRKDHVLVFAQYRPMIDALAKAFKKASIDYTNLAAVGDDAIAQKLEEFKAGKAGQVLLLDMDSETSAGSNLTIARHVIFANPYVHHDEEHQARTVRQARGRAIRIGQTKTVHVYHFMVSGTIEEETLRKFGRDSPAVKNFFDHYDRVPWWLDDGGDNGKHCVSDDQAS